MPKICPRYVRDMQNICPRCANDMPRGCLRFPQLCSKYAQDIVESRKHHPLTHWLALQHGSKRSKKCIFVFCYSDEIFYCEKIHFRKVTSLWNPTNVQGCSVSISLIFVCAWLWPKENDLKISTKEPKHNILGWRWHGDCCETPKWEKEGKIQFHWLSMQEQSR